MCMPGFDNGSVFGSGKRKGRCEQKERHSHCDRCEDYGLIWLDGVGILCWGHYCEEMAGQRHG
jgi:hypothetical protein